MKKNKSAKSAPIHDSYPLAALQVRLTARVSRVAADASSPKMGEPR